MKASRWLLPLFLLTTMDLLHAAPPSSSISFDATHVVASGFRAGRGVLIFGIARAPGPYFARMLRYADTLVADSSGVVRYEIADGVPNHSVWFAIDAQTRDYTAGSPDPAALRPSLNAPVIHPGVDAGNDVIDLDRRLMDFFIVRPGSGAWIGSCGRNSRKDLNRGKNGLMQASAAQLSAARGSTGHPSTILPSDLIILIDSETLEYYAGSPSQH